MIDKSQETKWLFPIARHVGVDLGLTYPMVGEIERTYIDALKTPDGGVKSYDEIFDYAKHNVTKLWSSLAAAIYNNKDDYLTTIDNWDLDTGLRLNDPKTHVFW